MDMELNRKKFVEHVENGLVVKDENGDINLVETNKKRESHMKNIEKFLEGELLNLEEQELRLKLYKQQPGRCNPQFKFEELDEWKEYEFKRSVKVFEESMKTTKENIDSYKMQIEILKSYLNIGESQ